jgi:tetratricopeptide (TPR) repeat protein
MRGKFSVVLALVWVFAALPASARNWTDDAQQCYKTHGDLTLAITYCTRAIESGQLTNAELSVTYVNRGGHFLDRGEIERSLADFEAAIRLDPNDSRAYVARGLLYRGRGEESAALAEFDHAISISVSSNDAWGYLDRARAYKLKGDLKSALDALNTANQIDPKIPEVYEWRAEIYYAQRDYRKAASEYDKSLEVNPNNPDILSSRGDCYLDLGDLQRALQDYNAAISLQPSQPDYYSDRAWVHRIFGEHDQAIADYTEAIRLEPNRGLRYTNRAAAYRAKGDWKSAMADYDRAVEAEPDRGRYRSSRAGAHEYEGDYKAALVDRDEAIRLEPKNADLYVNRAWTLLYNGQTEEALAGFADAIRIDPRASVRYRSRGYAFLYLQRYDEALADFEQAIRVEPAQGVNYDGRSDVFLYRGKPLDGLPDLDRAEAADHDYAASSSRGFLHLAALQPDEAIRDYAAYITSRPNAGVGFSGRGFARMMKGDLKGANEDFAHALDFNVWDTQTMLWLHFSRARLGQDDSEDLAKEALRFDPKKWPGPALSFALGKLPLNSMLLAAKDPSELKTRQQEAEAYFYAGEYYLATHRPLAAKKMFREALDRNVPYRWAHVGAAAELANIKPAPAPAPAKPSAK